MLSIWDISAPSGISLGVLPERRAINLPLPTSGSVSGISFSVIAGSLPAGTYLKNNFLVGTTFEVSTPAVSTFVIRATNGTEISDRTYSITVYGENLPQWITPAGNIRVGEPELFYVLDNSYVDYQLIVIDSDTAAGQQLSFFIKPNSGTLPPGLKLLPDGRIVGYIAPIPALDANAGTGGYDTSMFDQWYFDFGKTITSLNDVGVPFNFNQRPQRKLNRNYQFTVSVSDGIAIVDRIFRIFVVADNYLRADNVDMSADTLQYTADNTYLRPPVWITPSDLGEVRANNFSTIYLEAKDPNPEVGPVVYSVVDRNDDSTISELPPNLFIDPATGELFGYLPYQPAISKNYSFTVAAKKYDAFEVSEATISIQVLKNVEYGNRSFFIRKLLPGESAYLINQQLLINNLTYIVDSYEETNLHGILTLKQPLVNNIIAGTELSKDYILAYSDNSVAVSYRQFNIKIKGEVDSTINWVSDSNLGTLRANTPSLSFVKATSTVSGAVLSYSLIGGQLPPGISLLSTGELSGNVKQFSSPTAPGLTIFDSGHMLFDNQLTTFDRKFIFTVKVQDQFNYSADTKTFFITIKTPDDRRYTNIFAKPFLTKNIRAQFNAIINDSSIFTPEYLYRLGDPNFGVQTEMKMLVYPGLEVVDIDYYATALITNAKKRRYNLGPIKTAVAKAQGTSDITYEIIYIEVTDLYESTHSSSPASSVITNNVEVFPSNINNMQRLLSNIQLPGSSIKSEYEYLPLWMLTPQSTSTAATGFISAIPLAYCKPGKSKYILENMMHANIDFSFVNYEIDRLIVEDVLNINEPQYLLFNNNKTNI